MKKKSTLLLKNLLIFLLLISAALQTSFAQLTPVSEVEAESGVLTGLTASSAGTGFSGTGYVTGFDNSEDKVTVIINTPAEAFYRLVIKYNSTSGEKTQDLIINSDPSEPVVFPQTTTFSDLEAGKYLLKKGSNTITIKSSWGYMDVDKFSVYSAEKNSYAIVSDLVDPDASDATKALYNFMVSQFGKKIISGQTSDYFDEIKNITKNSPMLRAFDFQSYTEGYPYLWSNGGHTFGSVDNGSVKTAIEWYNSTDKKGIVSFQWHWHSPSGGNAGTNTFYTEYTTFDVTRAVLPGTQENEHIIRDIDAIAVQLKKLNDAGVPVLWRPLHEAGGAWFWWGANGPEACKKLYDIIYDRMMKHHNLHNLIWVWSSPEEEWYPGNNKIDIVGHDSYPGLFNYGIQKNTFDRLHKLTEGKKLIAMTENGPIPDPDNCLRLDAPWSYFMSWVDLVTKQNSTEHIVNVYTNPRVLSFGANLRPDTVVIEQPDTTVTSVSDEEGFGIKIFPNPARDFINIEGANSFSLFLSDLNSNVVFRAERMIDRVNIDQLSPGLYILTIYKGQSVLRKKIIIEN